jgi:hypothetical protein
MFDWRGQVILTKLTEGCTIREAGKAAGITKQAILKRRAASPDFAEAVAAARDAGKAERTYRLWLRHPFRGKRPPTGKGHGGKPVYIWGQGAGARRG